MATTVKQNNKIKTQDGRFNHKISNCKSPSHSALEQFRVCIAHSLKGNL